MGRCRWFGPPAVWLRGALPGDRVADPYATHSRRFDRTVRPPPGQDGNGVIDSPADPAGNGVIGQQNSSSLPRAPRFRKPSPRPSHHSFTDDDHDFQNEAIYERESVKRGRCRFCGRDFPHIPFAVGVGRSGPSQTCRRTSWCASRSHPLSLRPREMLPLDSCRVRTMTDVT